MVARKQFLAKGVVTHKLSFTTGTLFTTSLSSLNFSPVFPKVLFYEDSLIESFEFSKTITVFRKL